MGVLSAIFLVLFYGKFLTKITLITNFTQSFIKVKQATPILTHYQ